MSLELSLGVTCHIASIGFKLALGNLHFLSTVMPQSAPGMNEKGQRLTLYEQMLCLRCQIKTLPWKQSKQYISMRSALR